MCAQRSLCAQPSLTSSSGRLYYSVHDFFSWGIRIARRSNQSILKDINFEYSLEGLMLKLKLQYSGHLMGRATHWKIPWCLERLKAGGEEGWHRMKWSDSITDSVNLSKPWEIVEDRGAWRAAVHGVTESQIPLTDWTRTRSRFKCTLEPSHLDPQAWEQETSVCEILLDSWIFVTATKASDWYSTFKGWSWIILTAHPPV